MDPMDPPVELPPEPGVFPAIGSALRDELDKLLLVQLRDGRKVIGKLRCFDHFANFVLEDAHERIVVGKEFADDPIGLYVVRGENVVFLGDIDETRDPPAGLTRVSVKEAKRAQHAEREAGRIRGTLLASMDFLDE